MVSDTDTKLGTFWVKIPPMRSDDFEKFNGSKGKFRKLTKNVGHVSTKTVENRSCLT